MLLKRPAAVGKKLFLWRGFGPDGPQPSAGVEWLKQSVSRVRGVGHNLPRSPQGPRGMQVLEGRLVDDTLQPALVLGSGSSVPDGDGGGEDGLNDGCVEVHHHCLWQVEFLQLP